ncbi:MAG: 2,3-bisphosphoglycerate-independent phosphoglycerate mutase [Archaeoglobales archaeon]|nr:MAG: 2,3-bisphosphoglycerate-independent phosphoglycerate mutase [Archaeoglobales archaeon]
MKRILMVIVDGLSDRSIDGKTPLSVANKPNMDKIAEIGINGIMDTIAPGVRPGSDTGHLALLGYDPYKYYSGRGPIEAAGAGIDVKPGDVAFRVNFGTVEGEGSIFDKVVVDRRAGRISDTDELVKAVCEGVKLDVEFIFKRGSGHRGALVLRGEELSDKISDTDPHKIGAKVWRCRPLDGSKEAKRTAEIVNSFMEQSHSILDSHPLNEERAKKGLLKANALLLRGAGMCPHIPSFEEKYGMKLAVIAGTTLIKGVGRIVKGEVLEVEGATGNKYTNLDGKVKAAIEALKTYDFVLLHIKATDELGHDGDFDGKKEFIEKLDKAIEPLLNLDFSKVCMILTADHSTPIMAREHTADPVPITIVHEGVRVDEVRTFSEFEAYKGGLCRIRGRDVINIALDLIDRAKKFGA